MEWMSDAYVENEMQGIGDCTAPVEQYRLLMAEQVCLAGAIRRRKPEVHPNQCRICKACGSFMQALLPQSSHHPRTVAQVDQEDPPQDMPGYAVRDLDDRGFCRDPGIALKKIQKDRQKGRQGEYLERDHDHNGNAMGHSASGTFDTQDLHQRVNTDRPIRKRKNHCIARGCFRLKVKEVPFICAVVVEDVTPAFRVRALEFPFGSLTTMKSFDY